MANESRWNPRRELASLRDNMNRILEDGLGAIGSSSSGLALDIYETTEAVIIETSPLVGIDAEQIEVSITDDILTIQGETVDVHAGEDLNYLRKERRFGAFSRSVSIPRPIRAEETTAKFKDGILTISIPKEPEAQPQVIDVSATDEDSAG